MEAASRCSLNKKDGAHPFRGRLRIRILSGWPALRKNLSGTRFKPNGQRSVRRLLQRRIPLKTTIGTPSSIGGRIALQLEQKRWGAPISRPLAHPDLFGIAPALRKNLSGNRFEAKRQCSVRRLLQRRIPFLSVGRDAAGRKPAPTPCPPPNAGAKTSVGPASLIKGLAAPQPPGRES